LKRQLDGKRRATRWDIPYANGPPMLRDDSIANAQAETCSFADRFRRVEGIENPGSVFYPGPAVGDLNAEAVAIERGAYPNIAFGRMFQDGINRVVSSYLERPVGAGVDRRK